jgi:hypothetical protein
MSCSSQGLRLTKIVPGYVSVGKFPKRREIMMKRSLAIVTLVILALSVPVQMLAQQSKAKKEVLAVVDEINQANRTGGAEGAAALEKYLADGLVRVPVNGALLTKDDILNGYRTGIIKFESVDISDIKVQMYGNTAVVTGVDKRSGMMLGADVSGMARWTRVFVKHGGAWKMVAYQQTKVAQ